MMYVENIINALKVNEELIGDDCNLYVEIDGEIRELCNITFIDGKVVLRPDVKL